jgi:hypothetical protein
MPVYVNACSLFDQRLKKPSLLLISQGMVSRLVKMLASRPAAEQEAI